MVRAEETCSSGWGAQEKPLAQNWEPRGISWSQQRVQRCWGRAELVGGQKTRRVW